MTVLDADAEQHLGWCADVRGLSAGTVRVRESVLRILRRVLGRPLRDATAADLLRWEESALTRKPATQKAYTSHVVSFYAWLVESGAIPESPASVLAPPKVDRRSASSEGAPPEGQPGQGVSSAELLDRWVMAMRAAGNAERTYVERRRLLERVARHTGQQPAEFTADALAEYLAGLHSAATRSTYWGGLRAWFVWLVDVEELRADNPMRKLRRPKVPRRRPRPVTDDQLQRVLAAANRRRTRTWVLLATYQGLRVHEIAKVRGEDVDLVGGTLRVLGKGGTDEELPLHPLVAAEAEHYPRRGWWFPSYEKYGRGGEHVLANTVSQIIGNAFRRAGVQCSAHQLRHWFGTNTLRAAGGNLRVAQELLRHASIATTALYTQVDDSERRAAIMALPA